MRKIQPPEERFWSKVDSSGGEDACWIWRAGRNPKGYGQVWWNGRHRTATHISWELANGKEFPADLWALHKCDNPPCVNPKHLFLGTNQDNIDDRERKGRGNALRGEEHYAHKLSDAQVADIRQRYSQGGVTQLRLSEIFQVGQGYISAIVTYRIRR